MTHTPTGWNTWDYRGPNRLVYLAEGRVRLVVAAAIWDEHVKPDDPRRKRGGTLTDTLRWEHVRRAGRHAPLGLPAELEFAAGRGRYRLEASEVAGGLVLRVMPLRAAGQRIVFLLPIPADTPVEADGPVAGWFAGFRITLEGAAWPHDYFLNLDLPYAIGEPDAPAVFRATRSPSENQPPPAGQGAAPSRSRLGWDDHERDARATQPITGARGPSTGCKPVPQAPIGGQPPPAGQGAAPSRSRLGKDDHGRDARATQPITDARGPSTGCKPVPQAPIGGQPRTFVPVRGEGALAEAPRVMLDVLAWNTLYDARRRLVVSPVSRDWCHDWRGPIVFCWDTFFAGLMAAAQSPALARLNFEAALASVDALGFVPNYVMAHGAASLDRSMPPLGAWAIWKTQAPAPDRAWLAEIYPRLRTWHTFWLRHRDGRGAGLLAWGSDAQPAYDFPDLVPYNPTLRHSDRAARWESGLDNSPMYDDVPFNPHAHTLELDDVGLCSYYALDCEALAEIAAALDRDDEAAAYRREHEAVGRRINAQLWDDDAGIYCNRHWDGRLSRRWSPTSFFPLLAGVAPRDRAERMVAEHLLNPREFWGEFVIPSISRADPAFADNDYWRGRIWGPFNLLVAEGLRRYRFDDAAAELAAKSLDLFLRNWRRDGGVYENYNAQTGAGGDVWNAARLYHWGGLLALVAIQELIDVEPAGWWRFGSVQMPAAAIRRLRAGGSVWDVELGDGVSVWRDGRPALECSTRAIIRVPLAESADRSVHITARRPGRLVLYPNLGRWERAVLSGGAVVPAARTAAGVTFTWTVQA